MGEGSDYKPWLTIQNVASHGRVHRIKGWKTEREHHFLSDLELHYFYLFDWAPSVVDIREQYPLLPLDDTIAISEELGIRHPTDPTSKESIVMTTDFLLTVVGREGLMREAIAVKPARELQKPRIIEKLELERLYWRTAGVSWCIGTERNLDMVVVKNLALLHDYRSLPETPLTSDDIASITTELTNGAAQSLPLRKIAAHCDKTLGVNHGTSLTIAYHLIATRQWQVDMHVAIDPGKPISFLSDRKPNQDDPFGGNSTEEVA